MRPKRTKKPVLVKTTTTSPNPNPTNMAPATKKRKAKAMMDPLNPLRPSKKRIRSLRPRKDAIHPFTELPPEIQSRIMGFCDSKTLAAISLVNNYYRELSLRVMWETQPVETYIKNFKQLDEHEDLRLAVRHLAIRKQSAPNKSRFSGVAKRLQTRFPKNYFPGLQELTIEYDLASSDSFVSVINTVSKYQPKRLKTMNITIAYKMTRRYNNICDSNKDPRQDSIIYPTGLTSVSVEFLYSSFKIAFDPLKAFDANSETVKTARVCFSKWPTHFSMKQCPKVTTLITKQDQCDIMCAKELFTKFPNTQHLVINAPYCGIVWVPADRTRLMGRYVDWRIFSSVKSAQIIYSGGIRYGKSKIELRDSVIGNITYLVKQWISDGFMPELKVVDVFVRRFEYPREDTTEHSFTLKVELKDMVRVVTTDRITRYQEETFAEQLKARQAEKEKEKEKLEAEEAGSTVLAQPVLV